MKKQAVVTDIMGTTTPSTFVRSLVGDFIANGATYLARSEDKYAPLIEAAKQKIGNLETVQLVEEVAARLKQRDLQPEYLALVGAANVESYQSGTLQGELYSDVPIACRQWVREEGKLLFSYSNGSSESQAALFKHNNQVDLGTLFSGHFDTGIIGSKTDSDSYKRLAEQVQKATTDILFLSDLESELDAADTAQMKVCLVNRTRGPVETGYQSVASFLELLR